jgi:hypothetical protein
MILEFFPTTTQKMKTLETTTQPKFCVEFPGFSSVFPALLGNSTLHIAETARLPWAERLCVLPGSNTRFSPPRNGCSPDRWWKLVSGGFIFVYSKMSKSTAAEKFFFEIGFQISHQNNNE